MAIRALTGCQQDTQPDIRSPAAICTLACIRNEPASRRADGSRRAREAGKMQVGRAWQARQGHISSTLMAFGLSAPSASPRLARLLGASPRSSIGRFLDASAPARTQKRTRPRQRTTRTRTLRGPPPRSHPPVLPRMRLLRDLPPHHLLPRRRPCPGALDPHLSSSSSYILYPVNTRFVDLSPLPFP